MFAEANPQLRQLLRFLLLPRCVWQVASLSECPKPKWSIVADMLYIFFVLRNFPDNYGPCRLWEYPRESWAMFYGSNYNPFQREVLRKRVHPFYLERAMQDKEVADGIAKRSGLRVPNTLAVIEPATDYRGTLRQLFDRSAETRLIIKPVLGHAGIGISMARKVDGNVVVSQGGADLSVDRFEIQDRCIVQEVVTQHPKMAAVFSGSLNTVRVLTMLSPEGEFFVLGASVRFGVGGAFVDNWSAGGVAVGIYHQTGQLRDWGFDKVGRRYVEHPGSKVKFGSFTIPLWSDLISYSERVHRTFPFFALLGMDLGITQSEIVLIEINNDADIVFQEQTSGPLLADRKTWDLFRSHGLLYNERQQRLYRT